MITVIMKRNNNNYNNRYRPAQFKFTLSINITLQSLLLLFSVFRLSLLSLFNEKVKVLMACFIFEFYFIIILLHRVCCAWHHYPHVWVKSKSLVVTINFIEPHVSCWLRQKRRRVGKLTIGMPCRAVKKISLLL